MTASDTPLLLIAWRRPHTLRQVIDAIRLQGLTPAYRSNALKATAVPAPSHLCQSVRLT
jgi:hypothetical protein